MDRIHYAGDTFITGSAIAAALIEYARALAESDASDTVDVPTVDADGTIRRTRFLIGPASQLASDETETQGEELVDEELVAEITNRRANARRSVAVTDEMALPYVADDLHEYEL